MSKIRDVIPQVSVMPESSLAVLSQSEVNDLCVARKGPVYDMFRRCALAALTSGLESDDARQLLEAYPDFDVNFEQVDRGLRLHLTNAPAQAFVEGRLIKGIRELLFAVLRDIVFIARELGPTLALNNLSPAGITNMVFHLLRQAGLLSVGSQRGLVV
jgi:hypothetical protein